VSWQYGSCPGTIELGFGTLLSILVSLRITLILSETLEGRRMGVKAMVITAGVVSLEEKCF